MPITWHQGRVSVCTLRGKSPWLMAGVSNSTTSLLLATESPFASRFPMPPKDLTLSQEPERVLVVDDEPALRRALKTSLSVSGYIVEQASNGEEALAVF